MTRVDRSIVCVAILVLGACGATKKEVAAAQHSLYDIDFAVVYGAAMEATKSLYPTLNENPGPGKISTAWHQVSYSNCAGPGSSCDDLANATTIGGNSFQSGAAGMGQQGQPGNTTLGGVTQAPTRLVSKRYFIRFDVSVVGGRPWRVKVAGHASEWDPGAAMPVEMHGANKPMWLDPRIQSLEVAIYKRIKQYAIPMQEETKPAEEEHKTDPSTFRDMPAAAAKRLAEIKDALAHRDYASLKTQLADDVQWSLGGGSGADTAMAMWQADPALFDTMAATLASCAADGDKKVACPGGTPAPKAYQLVIEPRGDVWRVTAFVQAE
jgi:hypothetical protein